MSGPLTVEVVSATGIAWEGKAISVIARTTEGDIGIMADHEPFLAGLVPSAAEVLTVDGLREIVALDGGLISVAENRVSLLSEFARVAREIDLRSAEHELADAEKRLDAGETDEETMRHYRRSLAQVKAARLAGERA